MSEVAEYVGTHYREELHLKDVAERFFVSPYYLSRTFKRCTGFGFAEYVQLVRIRERAAAAPGDESQNDRGGGTNLHRDGREFP